MTYRITSTSDDDRAYFRCPVVGEKGIGGYTVTVPAKYASKLARSTKKDWLICYDDTKALVRAQALSKPLNGVVRINLRQEQDLTKPERIKSSFWSRFTPSGGDSNTATVAYGGFVLLLFAAMAMPGLGDQLGTSKRIQKTFHWVLRNAEQQADVWTR